MVHLTKHLPTLDLVLDAETGTRLERHLRDDFNVCMDEIGDLEDEMNELYGQMLGFGGSRLVWQNGPVVYKIPSGPSGFANQHCEHDAYLDLEAYENVPVAPCMLVWHGSGIPIIVMEAVKPADHNTPDLPEWSTCVDDQQIGQRANGEWVVFDAGHPALKIGTYDGWVTNGHRMPSYFAHQDVK